MQVEDEEEASHLESSPSLLPSCGPSLSSVYLPDNLTPEKKECISGRLSGCLLLLGGVMSCGSAYTKGGWVTVFLVSLFTEDKIWALPSRKVGWPKSQRTWTLANRCHVSRSVGHFELPPDHTVLILFTPKATGLVHRGIHQNHSFISSITFSKLSSMLVIGRTMTESMWLLVLDFSLWRQNEQK